MTSVHQRIAEARRALVRVGFTQEDAALDAEILARHVLGWDRAQLLTSGREPMPPGFDEQFAALVQRRVVREPVAFITGHREFWGLDFEVSRDVLIPRPESELIVEAACESRPERTGVHRIIDVGTGSGCLAVALAAEFPGARVLATDISEAALAVATRNASRHVDGRVSFLRADLLEAVIGPVDLIVSNPPYVSSVVELSPDIVRFEPPVALYSGENGLSLISRLIPSAQARLASDGLFVLEFGLGQDEDVQALAKAAGWRDVRIKTDLQGIPRVAIMTKKSAVSSQLSAFS